MTGVQTCALPIFEKNRVYTEGKGEKQPVADNKTKEGKKKNRRVEIEVVGTRTKK